MTISVGTIIWYVSVYVLVAWAVGFVLNITDSLDEGSGFRDTVAWLWPISLPILLICLAAFSIIWSYSTAAERLTEKYNEWRCSMGDHKLSPRQTLRPYDPNDTNALKHGYTGRRICINCGKEFYFK